MEYILIKTEDGRSLYQEIQQGNLQRICDLDGNTVDPLLGPAWIENSTPVQPTWALPDVIEPVIAPRRRITKLAYMNRFTDTELGMIYTVAKSNVSVEIWLAKFNATTPDMDGTSIDLDDARTVLGLHAMEAAGLLQPGRALEILNA
jgi:hypothetical protein